MRKELKKKSYMNSELKKEVVVRRSVRKIRKLDKSTSQKVTKQKPKKLTSKQRKRA